MTDITYSEIRDNRTKINNLVFPSSGSNRGNKKFCVTCIEHWALILKEIDGQKVYWCHGCGKTIPFASLTESGKYKSKYGSPANTQSFIASQPRNGTKPRKQIGSANDSLTEEDIDDLRRSGINVS